MCTRIDAFRFLSVAVTLLVVAVGAPQLIAQQQAAAQADVNAPEPPGFDAKYAYKKVGDTSLWLYAYKPKGHQADAKKPAIVFFFGGAWKNGSPGQFAQHCKYLAARGMVAMTVEYRVSSRHPVKVEDCIEDAKSAMRWVRGNAQSNGDRS